MDEVEIVVAHSERATLRVGDVFLKVDADQSRTDVEIEAMATVPVPTPEVLWRRPPVLALAAVPGYGDSVDRELIQAWWSLRCLSNVRWLVTHGFGPAEDCPEVSLLLRSPP